MPIANVAYLQARIDQNMVDRNGAPNVVKVRTYTYSAPSNPDITARTVTGSTDITLSPPPIVEEIGVREALDSGGLYNAGDKRYIISSSAITNSQLTAAEDIIDATDTLRIVERNHDMVVGGQVLTWKVVASMRRAS